MMSDRPEFYLTTDPQLVALREGLREVMDPERSATSWGSVVK